jgi:hypothetical protein
MEYWMMTTGNQGEPGIDGGIAARRIEKAGGTITIPRMPIPGVGWVAYAVDTEGKRPPDHRHG